MATNSNQEEVPSDPQEIEEDSQDKMDDKNPHSNVDESPDISCTENETDSPTNISSDDNEDQKTEKKDMRLKENREELIDEEGRHWNTDDTPDKRCKENQVGSDSPSDEPQSDTDEPVQEETKETDTDIPTKADEPPNEKLAGGDETISIGDNEEFSEGSTSTDIPTKSDGTAASGEITRDQVLSGDNENSSGEVTESLPGMMSNLEIGGGGDGDGPLKADGTSDMDSRTN